MTGIDVYNRMILCLKNESIFFLLLYTYTPAKLPKMAIFQFFNQSAEEWVPYKRYPKLYVVIFIFYLNIHMSLTLITL